MGAHHTWGPVHHCSQVEEDPELRLRPGHGVLPPGQARSPGCWGEGGSPEEAGHSEGGGEGQEGGGCPFPGARQGPGRGQEGKATEISSPLHFVLVDNV